MDTQGRHSLTSNLELAMGDPGTSSLAENECLSRAPGWKESVQMWLQFLCRKNDMFRVIPE